MTAPAQLGPSKEEPEVIAYQRLRLVIGLLGIGLPVVCYAGGRLIGHVGVQSSLSSYYYTNMGDVFVGILCAIGVFLFSYKGYSDDKGAPGKWACAFAIGVALFPTDRDCTPGCGAPHQFSVHLLFAALLFITLTYYAGVLFRKGSPAGERTPKKLLRNKIYLGCAIIMALCIVVLAAWTFILEPKMPALSAIHPVFWLEAVAIVAFGFSWLVKSEWILAG
jgi:hypothetical protein